MQKKKVLYWLLPKSHFGSDHCIVNYRTKEVDVGLGHRLSFLISSFVLSIVSENNFDIVLEKEKWPESKFIKFPNQIAFKSIKKEEVSNCLPLTEKNFLDFFIKRDFEYLNKHTSFKHSTDLCTELLLFEVKYHQVKYEKYNISFDEFKKLKSKLLNEISKIKLVSEEANNFLKNKLKGHMGLYIRRTHIPMTMEDVNTLPENLREDFISDYWQGNVDLYKNVSQYLSNQSVNKFISDEVYFQRIDKILETNPEQKFYLSCNVKTKYIQHYKERYPNKIITRDDLISEFFSFFGSNLSKYDTNILTYLLDLFSLCNCERDIIYTYYSFWVIFAEYSRLSKKYFPSIDLLDYTLLNITDFGLFGY